MSVKVMARLSNSQCKDGDDAESDEEYWTKGKTDRNR
jgi:hypothetical protein